MSFESAYKGYEREELRFTSELDWLGVLAFGIVSVIASMQIS